MHELTKIKIILETQIETTRDMIKDTKNQLDDTKYRQGRIARLEAKIDAWEETLKAVNREVYWAEMELERLKIFEPNEASTYGLA